MIPMGEEKFGPSSGGNWNVFREIRDALGLKQDREFLGDFLNWWVTMSRDEHHLYRTIDLSKLDEYDLPKPPEELKLDAQERVQGE